MTVVQPDIQTQHKQTVIHRQSRWIILGYIASMSRTIAINWLAVFTWIVIGGYLALTYPPIGDFILLIANKVHLFYLDVTT